jgi:hypothetical protein
VYAYYYCWYTVHFHGYAIAIDIPNIKKRKNSLRIAGVKNVVDDDDDDGDDNNNNNNNRLIFPDKLTHKERCR